MKLDREILFDEIRKSHIFGRFITEQQVWGVDGILDAFHIYGDENPKTLAYALATAYHETGARMRPVREGFAETDAMARNIVAKLARKRGPKSAVAKYSQPVGSYGHVYYGRGHVQLTWMENYKETGSELGIDLVADPDRMLDPFISARVLIRGLIDGRWNGKGKGIGFYLPKDGKDDLKNARRTVNIIDSWDDIASYYQKFLSAVKAAQIEG